MMFKFEVRREGKKVGGRLGRLSTPHGSIDTPAYIFCGTRGVVRGIMAGQLEESGVSMVLGNTYHLLLEPGGEVLEKFGGLGKFMRWSGPTLTDSGGFQIFSLGYGGVSDEIKGRRVKGGRCLVKIKEEGAYIRSYRDGHIVCLSPERSILEQRRIGADIILTLDECTPYKYDYEETACALARTNRWQERSILEYERSEDDYNGRQVLYGIIQGGIYEDLRRESVDYIIGRKSKFFGQAIGGSLGRNKEEMYSVIESTCNLLSKRDKFRGPTHLLGIGSVEDILRGVSLGIDTFDSVFPTRLGRHGGALVSRRVGVNYRINLNNEKYRQDENILEEGCDCICCREGYSRGYLRHLLKTKEFLGGHLVTLHNIRFIVRLMELLRRSIEEDSTEQLDQWLGH